MKHKIFYLFIVFIVLMAMQTTWATEKYEIPEEIKKVAPTYPDIIRILDIMNLPNGVGVILAVNGTPMEVFDFYKKAMTEKAWEIFAEKADENNSGLLLKKENGRLQISARKRATGGSTVIVALRHVEPEKKAEDAPNS